MQNPGCLRAEPGQSSIQDLLFCRRLRSQTTVAGMLLQLPGNWSVEEEPTLKAMLANVQPGILPVELVRASR